MKRSKSKAKAKPGRCVHCLQEVDTITADHLFPKSWYPDRTPANLERWTVPACRPCNSEYGRIEENLRLVMVACVDPTSEAAAGLWPKVRDSMDPTKGKNPMDTLHRKLRAGRFQRGMEAARPDLLQHQLPEIYPDRPKSTIALRVSEPDLRRFVEKLVRGTIYLTERKFVDQHQIKMSLIPRGKDADLQQIFDEFGEAYERGAAIRIRKAAASEAPDQPLFVFDIWDQFRFYAYVEPIADEIQ
jgi:hypothetical protein